MLAAWIRHASQGGPQGQPANELVLPWYLPRSRAQLIERWANTRWSPATSVVGVKEQSALGRASVRSASWWGNGLPRRRPVGGVRARPPATELRHGPYTYGWQQSRIFDNGRKPDRATPRGGRSPSGCKHLFLGKNFGDGTQGIRGC